MLEDLGEAINRRVQRHIQDQDLGWEPLKISTVSKKGHETIYVDTWDYMRSIQSVVKREGALSLNLTVAPMGKHASSGLDMQTLAGWLEYGTSRMEGRELWQPVMREVRDMEEFSEFFEELGSSLRFNK